MLREEIRRLKVEARHREDAVLVSLFAMLLHSHKTSIRNLGPRIPDTSTLEPRNLEPEAEHSTLILNPEF